MGGSDGAAFNLIIVRAVFTGSDLRGRDLAWMAIRSRRVGILRLTLIGHGRAVFLVFTAIYLALRYRFDLAPFMTLAALVGYRWTSIASAEATDLWRRRLRIAATGSCFLGILCSHYVLLLYKVWSMGVPSQVRSALLPFSPLAPY